jgi:DNA-binding LytR/AlgR family response regulator
MICIGICDDEKQIIEVLKEKIMAYMESCTMEVNYLEFYSGEELLNSESQLDLLFLDIDMPGMDGIETGKRFRAQNRDCKIVMETARSDRMKEAFFLEAYRFIEKPFQDSEINEALSAFLESRIGFQKICLWERRKMVEVYQYQILLAQTYGSYTEFLVGSQTLRSEKSLKELEAELDDRMFVRIDKQYIVNLKYIDRYENGSVSIAGELIKVSRRRLRSFEEKYREYDLRYR